MDKIEEARKFLELVGMPKAQQVWIAEMPEHMIHLNGDKFLGPR